MSFREKLRNPFVQQYLLEILLPLIGFFFFDWTLTIIAVFYLVDQFAAETSFVRKFIRIRTCENKSFWLMLFSGIIIFAGAMTLEIVVLHDYLKDFGTNDIFRIYEEVEVFAKDELWFLFPLILIMYYLKDQFTFFMPRRYLHKESNRFFLWHQLKTTGICILVTGGLLMVKNLELTGIVLIVIFLALKILFDFTIGKLAEKKSAK